MKEFIAGKVTLVTTPNGQIQRVRKGSGEVFRTSGT